MAITLTTLADALLRGTNTMAVDLGALVIRRSTPSAAMDGILSAARPLTVNLDARLKRSWGPATDPGAGGWANSTDASGDAWTNSTDAPTDPTPP